MKINGKPAYVAYISPSQINVQAPADSAFGPVPVEVNNNGVTSPAATLQLQPTSPAFFLWNGKYAVATRQDFSLAGPSGLFAGAPTVPVKPGEIVILWGTGFGASNPSVAAGTVAPSNPVANVTSPVTVTIGDLAANVIGAALAPGNAGLYQIAIEVPPAAPDGDQAVVARIGGVQSPAGAYLSVKQ